jgi:hypothetical protein
VRGPVHQLGVRRAGGGDVGGDQRPAADAAVVAGVGGEASVEVTHAGPALNGQVARPRAGGHEPRQDGRDQVAAVVAERGAEIELLRFEAERPASTGVQRGAVAGGIEGRQHVDALLDQRELHTLRGAGHGGADAHRAAPAPGGAGVAAALVGRGWGEPDGHNLRDVDTPLR